MKSHFFFLIIVATFLVKMIHVLNIFSWIVSPLKKFLGSIRVKSTLQFWFEVIYSFFHKWIFFGKFTSMSENKKRKSLGESNFHCKKQEVPKQTKFVYNPTQVLVVFIYTITKNIAPKNSWWWCWWKHLNVVPNKKWISRIFLPSICVHIRIRKTWYKYRTKK